MTGRPDLTASVPDPPGPWQFNDPRLDRAMIPYTDDDTAALIDETATSLVLMRAPMLLGDAGPTISVLVSLAGQAEQLLFDAVADAKDQGYTWDQIASRLATTTATARRRYAAYTRWRNTIETIPPTPTINEPADANDITGPRYTNTVINPGW
jgi:hypothetical protein